MKKISIPTPETFVTADPGTQVIGSDGSIWTKLTGSGNTGWIRSLTSSDIGDLLAELVDGKLPAVRLPSTIDARLIPVRLTESEANDYIGDAGEFASTDKSVRVSDGITPGGGFRLYNHGKRSLTIYGVDSTYSPSKKIPRSFIPDKPAPVFACTGNSADDVISAPGHNFVDGDTVGFLSITGTANLIAGELGWTTLYFVRDAYPGSFKITASPGGGAINWTGTFVAGTVQRMPKIALWEYIEADVEIDRLPFNWDGGADFETLHVDATFFTGENIVPDMSGFINLKKLSWDAGMPSTGPNIDFTGVHMLEELRIVGFQPIIKGDLTNLRKLYVHVADGWGFDFSQAPLLEKFVCDGASGSGLSLSLSNGSAALTSVVVSSQFDGLIEVVAETPLPNLTTMTFTSVGGFTFYDTTGLVALTALNLQWGGFAPTPLTFTNMVGLTSLTSLTMENMGNSGGVVLPATAELVGTLDALTTFTISGQYGSVEGPKLALIAAALVAAGNTNGTFTVEWNFADSTGVSGDLTVLNGHLATLRSRGWNAPDLVEPTE